jgi:hypothetical protein
MNPFHNFTHCFTERPFIINRAFTSLSSKYSRPFMLSEQSYVEYAFINAPCVLHDPLTTSSLTRSNQVSNIKTVNLTAILYGTLAQNTMRHNMVFINHGSTNPWEPKVCLRRPRAEHILLIFWMLYCSKFSTLSRSSLPRSEQKHDEKKYTPPMTILVNLYSI